MEIQYDEAQKEDIEQLIRLRVAYMLADFGKVGDRERACMEKQLLDYFSRKLGTELLAFVARDGKRIVSVAYLHIIEMPANLTVLNGRCGEVLNVYTEPQYRGKGICTELMKNLLKCGKERGLERVDLSATKEGYPIYKKVGFAERESHYIEMRYVY